MGIVDNNMMYDVRFLDGAEWNEAMEMVYRTFLEFDAPMFSAEGIEHFREYISDSVLKRMFEAGSFQVIAAYSGTKIIGVIALRNDSHISLLFVDSRYHRRGIGRRLVAELSEYVRIKLKGSFLTVNSSPYAVEFYRRLGFQPLDHSLSENGITYTPMKIVLES